MASISSANLTNEDKSILFNLFCKNIPKLSYEDKIYKKVYQSHLYLAIPRGIKGFLWFIEWNGSYYCFFIDYREGNTHELF
jgi:hypothetical protein